MTGPLVLDTSALIAILLQESAAPRLLAAARASSELVVTIATVVEAATVMLGRHGGVGETALDELLAHLGVTVLPVTATQGAIVRDAARCSSLARISPRRTSWSPRGERIDIRLVVWSRHDSWTAGTTGLIPRPVSPSAYVSDADRRPSDHIGDSTPRATPLGTLRGLAEARGTKRPIERDDLALMVCMAVESMHSPSAEAS